MKIYVLVFCLAFSHINSIPNFSMNKEVKKDRRLQHNSVMDSRILDQNNQISVEKIREEASELHRGIKYCINEEFAKDPDEILPFDTIRELCAGYDYSLIVRFFKDINFEVKEIVKEKIKANLRSGFCDNNLTMCLDYFSVLDMVMDKEYMVMETLRANEVELSRKIDHAKLHYMYKLTSQQIDDYNTIKEDIANEKIFFDEYFKDKLNEYNELMQKRDTSNLDAEVMQAINGDHRDASEEHYEEPEEESYFRKIVNKESENVDQVLPGTGDNIKGFADNLGFV